MTSDEKSEITSDSSQSFQFDCNYLRIENNREVISDLQRPVVAQVTLLPGLPMKTKRKQLVAFIISIDNII